jgi:hypothetical protein
MFMVLMYSDPERTKTMTAAEREDVFRRHDALHTDEASAMRNGAGLAYPEDSTTIRLHDGQPVASKGPFMAGTEQLTAYYIVECDSAERAEAIARRVLDFHVTAVEVREIHDSFGMDRMP